ncbi:MAG: protein serine/threonine phosphatase 2C family protein [Flavobacteriaceae bacterium]|nr:protein serine/threonine phosphatase 2C family protein [Flavobacteriaceae bacterium]
MHIEYTASSNKLSNKSKNGDAFGVMEIKEENLTLFVLADGVGGCVGDYKASKTVVDTFLKHFSENNFLENTKERIEKSIEAINNKVLSETGFYKGMKSTMVACVMDQNSSILHFVGIGDSRLYRVNEKGVEILTQDQVKAVIRRKQDGTPIIQAGAILNAIGVTNLIGTSYLKYEVKSLEVNCTTSFLLASDGFYNNLSATSETLLNLHSSLDIKGSFQKIVNDIAQKQNDDATAVFFRVEKRDEENLLSKQRLVCQDLLMALESLNVELTNKCLTYIEQNKVEQTFEFYDSSIKKMKRSNFNDSEIYQRLISLLKKTRL